MALVSKEVISLKNRGAAALSDPGVYLMIHELNSITAPPGTNADVLSTLHNI